LVHWDCLFGELARHDDDLLRQTIAALIGFFGEPTTDRNALNAKADVARNGGARSCPIGTLPNAREQTRSAVSPLSHLLN
jgi:hypothetical protein